MARKIRVGWPEPPCTARNLRVPVEVCAERTWCGVGCMRRRPRRGERNPDDALGRIHGEHGTQLPLFEGR